MVRSVCAALVASLSVLLAQSASAQSPAATEPTNTPSAANAAARATIAPRPISDLDVAYPDGASGDANVVLTLTVETDGSVSRALASETNEPFSTHAVNAALAWRFEPATRLGVPVRVRIRVNVAFHQPAAAEVPAEEATAADAPVPGKDAVHPPPAHKSIEIQVRGVKMDPSRTATLSRAGVRQIPGTFGDPFRAIEIMPGVTPIISGIFPSEKRSLSLRWTIYDPANVTPSFFAINSATDGASLISAFSSFGVSRSSTESRGCREL